jgi:hypothetical protein
MGEGVDETVRGGAAAVEEDDGVRVRVGGLRVDG